MKEQGDSGVRSMIEIGECQVGLRLDNKWKIVINIQYANHHLLMQQRAICYQQTSGAHVIFLESLHFPPQASFIPATSGCRESSIMKVFFPLNYSQVSVTLQWRNVKSSLGSGEVVWSTKMPLMVGLQWMRASQTSRVMTMFLMVTAPGGITIHRDSSRASFYFLQMREMKLRAEIKSPDTLSSSAIFCRMSGRYNPEGLQISSSRSVKLVQTTSCRKKSPQLMQAQTWVFRLSISMGTQMMWSQKSYQISCMFRYTQSMPKLKHCWQQAPVSRCYQQNVGSEGSRSLLQRKNLSKPSRRWYRMNSLRYWWLVASLKVVWKARQFLGGCRPTKGGRVTGFLCRRVKTMITLYYRALRFREGISAQQNPQSFPASLSRLQISQGILLQRTGSSQVKEKPFAEGCFSMILTVSCICDAREKYGMLGKWTHYGVEESYCIFAQKPSLFLISSAQQQSQSISLTPFTPSFTHICARDELKNLSCGGASFFSLLVLKCALRQGKQVEQEQQLYTGIRQAKISMGHIFLILNKTQYVYLGVITVPASSLSFDQAQNSLDVTAVSVSKISFDTSSNTSFTGSVSSKTYSNFFLTGWHRKNFMNIWERSLKKALSRKVQPKYDLQQRTIKVKLESRMPATVPLLSQLSPSAIISSASVILLSFSVSLSFDDSKLCLNVVLPKYHIGRAKSMQQRLISASVEKQTHAKEIAERTFQHSNKRLSEGRRRITSSPRPFSRNRANITTPIVSVCRLNLSYKEQAKMGAQSAPTAKPLIKFAAFSFLSRGGLLAYG